MIKDQVKELVEKAYQDNNKGAFTTKEDFWGKLVAETQRSVVELNEVAQYCDRMFELGIRGGMPIKEMNDAKGKNIIDVMLEKAHTSIEKVVKCTILLKRYQASGIQIIDMPEPKE